MKSPKVLVIGSTGMLGSAVSEKLSKAEIETLQASRSQGIRFDAERDSCDELISVAGLGTGDYVINCVGLTKTHIDDAVPATVERAVRLNAMFPIALAEAAEKTGARVIQVATDCVFSGLTGGYTESSPHDPHDAYGKTKSLGEVLSASVMHLRCSLVGPEVLGRSSLLFEWVRNLRYGAVVEGYVDHKWNGLTSHAFGSIVAGIILSGSFSSGVQHLVPADSLTKFELIKLELELLRRHDVTVMQSQQGKMVDRTLRTRDMVRNELLFRLGGYDVIPTVGEMMMQLPWTELGVE